jgi:NADH:ubiquinone oxidoreductase subunit C
MLFMANLNIIKNFKGIIPFIAYQNINSEYILTFSKNYLLFNLYLLKNQIQYQYKMLACISGVDLIEKKYRFCLSYELLSLVYNTRLRVKIFLNEIAHIPSLYSIFINSN